jgi:hypothetical protein
MEARLSLVAAEWAAIAARPAPDDATFRALRDEAEAIKQAGKWVSGPADVLTILGRHRDELFHSRMLGWLMSPSGRHGLGDRFLRAFLAEALPEVVAGPGCVAGADRRCACGPVADRRVAD